jgi:hypothetical protein
MKEFPRIAPRTFDAIDSFPTTSPIVSFAGPIVGSGITLLHKDTTPSLDDTQRKCCGFIQLSTYLSPGNPTETPLTGFHPFQVFVIFPIHANPWAVLCKKMVDRKETQFQSNMLFSCTGKVAGFLNHDTMVHPPQLATDYVFMVVPDAWKFHDKSPRGSVSMSPSPITTNKQLSMDPHGRSKFLSPLKKKPYQAATQSVTATSSTQQLSHANPTNLTCSSPSGTSLKFSIFPSLAPHVFELSCLSLTCIHRCDTGNTCNATFKAIK